MLRISRETDRAGMAALYQRCFDDEPGFAERVFDRVWKPSEALVYELDGKIVSMVLLPSFRLSENGRCGYVYALCTAPEYRGRGIMAEVLNGAHALCADRGDRFTLLVPAEGSLFSLYARFSYKPLVFVGESVYAHAVPAKALERARREDFAEINRLYERAFSGGDHILRDGADYETLSLLYGFGGGGFFVGDCGYVLADITPSGAAVREAVPTGGLNELLSGACVALGVSSLELRLPASSGRPYGCVRNAGGIALKEPFFYNLMYD